MILSQMVYFKFTNEKEIQYDYNLRTGHQLVDGLNIYHSTDTDSGFNFTDAKHLFDFLSICIKDECCEKMSGDIDINCTFYLREVTLPDDEDQRENSHYYLNTASSWHSKRIILGKRYRMDDVETIKYLITVGVTNWSYLINWAARHGFLHIVEYIRSVESTVGIDESNYWDCLESAARTGQLEIIQYLSTFCDIVNGPICNKSFIHKAVEYKQNHIVKYFVTNNKDSIDYQENLLRGAIKRANLKILQYFKKIGFDIKTNGQLALNEAAEHGYIKLAKFLVKHGVDIKYKNYLAVRIAADKKHMDMVKYLVRADDEIERRKEQKKRNDEKDKRILRCLANVQARIEAGESREQAMRSLQK